MLVEFFFVIESTKEKPKDNPVSLVLDATPEPVLDQSVSETPKKVEVVETKQVIQPIQTVSLTEIKKKFLSPNQYIQQSTEKTGIVLHHTVGGTWESTWNYWQGQKDRVATHFLIDRDGTIIQCLPLENWAYHIYIGSPGNKIEKKYKTLGKEYDKQLIGIELCSFGPLTARNGHFYNVYNREVNKDRVVELSYRGYKYWESYSPEQLLSLEFLLKDLLTKYPKIKENLLSDYKEIFNINTKALDLEPGIWSHTSYRTDKSDCVPTKELVSLLNSLKS